MKKIEWKDSIINSNKSIFEAVKRIDENGLQLVLITDEEQRLLGIITDGDVRRGIISGVDFSLPVSEIMNRHPISVRQGTSEEEIRRLMTECILHQVPVVDDDGRVVDLVFFIELLRRGKNTIPVVIMAGGLGTRLKEETMNKPKPLVNIGNKPILQTIIEGFVEQGFVNFFLSVNYKSEMIENYFGDGGKYGINIRYLRENKRMGTAGSLSLLPDDIEYPILVMNGDILTKVKYGDMIRIHKENKATATMAVREFVNTVPYGVIETKSGMEIDGKESEKQKEITTSLPYRQITQIKEKPVNKYLVNAGIYVLSKEAVGYVPQSSFFDMTQLFERIISDDGRAMSYIVDDYWIDIGQIEDLKRARMEFGEYF